MHKDLRTLHIAHGKALEYAKAVRELGELLGRQAEQSVSKTRLELSRAIIEENWDTLHATKFDVDRVIQGVVA